MLAMFGVVLSKTMAEAAEAAGKAEAKAAETVSGDNGSEPGKDAFVEKEPESSEKTEAVAGEKPSGAAAPGGTKRPRDAVMEQNRAEKLARRQPAPPKPRASALVAFGLGSVGGDGQRHNTGARVLEKVAGSAATAAAELSGLRDFGDGATGRRRMLLPPQGAINSSGQALKQALETLKLEGAVFLVVVDDCSLPLGTLRLKQKGSSNGHNALKDIESIYGKDYHRLKIGIGGKPTKEHVIGKFADEEAGIVEEMTRRGALAVTKWLEQGPEDIQKLMTLVNTPGCL